MDRSFNNHGFRKLESIIHLQKRRLANFLEHLSFCDHSFYIYHILNSVSTLIHYFGSRWESYMDPWLTVEISFSRSLVLELSCPQLKKIYKTFLLLFILEINIKNYWCNYEILLFNMLYTSIKNHLRQVFYQMYTWIPHNCV